MLKFRKLDTQAIAAFDRIEGSRVERVDTSLRAVIGRLRAKLGFRRTASLVLYGLLTGGGRPEIRALVADNLRRKQIRLPRIYAIRPLALTYSYVKGVQAYLLREALLLDRDPERIDIIFNGSVFPESVLASVSTPERRVFVESGFFPDTLQLDPQGLNGANSVPRDPAFYLDQGNGFAALGFPEATSRRATKSRFAPITLPETYIFVPFQVPSDMQVTQHSPWIRDMYHFLRVVTETAERNPQHTFVIKEHPSFRLSVIGSTAPHPRVIFANGNDTRELIAHAEAVITINSTVGIEALQAGKTVITLGNSCYNIPGLVLQAQDAPSLDAALNQTGWSPDDRLRRAFLSFLVNVYLVPGSLAKPPADLAQAITTRISRQQAAWRSQEH